MILETEGWIKDTLPTAHANEKSAKINLGLFPPVHCFTSLYLITFHVNISTLLFYLTAAVLGVVVLVEGETIMKTCSECKMECRSITAILHPSMSLVNMNVSLSFLISSFPFAKDHFLESCKYVAWFCGFSKNYCNFFMLFHTSIDKSFIKLSLKKLTNSVNHPKG